MTKHEVGQGTCTPNLTTEIIAPISSVCWELSHVHGCVLVERSLGVKHCPIPCHVHTFPSGQENSRSSSQWLMLEYVSSKLRKDGADAPPAQTLVD